MVEFYEFDKKFKDVQQRWRQFHNAYLHCVLTFLMKSNSKMQTFFSVFYLWVFGMIKNHKPKVFIIYWAFVFTWNHFQMKYTHGHTGTQNRFECVHTYIFIDINCILIKNDLFLTLSLSFSFTLPRALSLSLLSNNLTKSLF